MLSGIGKDLAREFMKHNCRVFASARNVSKLGSQEAGIDLVQLDVTDTDSIGVCKFKHLFTTLLNLPTV